MVGALLDWAPLGVVLRGFGANPTAMIASGWPALRYDVVRYLIAGLFSAAAGLLLTAINFSSDVNSSNSLHVAQRCGGCDGWIRVSVGQMFIVTNIDLSIPSVVTLGAYVALLTISGGTQTSSGCSCRPLIFGGATSAIGVFFANVLLILVVTLTQIMQLPHGSQDMVQASSSFLCSRWRDTKPIGRAAPTRSGPRYRLRCVADAFSRRSAPTRASRGPCSQIR
jgi:ribose/xylose/arabinose/galactoside ABC-type transport system permease subunit